MCRGQVQDNGDSELQKKQKLYGAHVDLIAIDVSKGITFKSNDE